RFLNLVLVGRLLRRFLHRGLPRRRHLLEQLPGLSHGVHRPLDDVGRNPARPQRVFERFRHALERRRAGRPLGVLGLQELDVVEDLIRLVVGERVELPQQAVTQDLVHGRVSRLIMSSTGLPRNRVRPVRTRAVTWMVASGVMVSSCARLASGTTTYKNPRSGSGRRADSTRDGSTGAEGLGLEVVSGGPTPDPRPGVCGSPGLRAGVGRAWVVSESGTAVRELATCATDSRSVFSSQPARVTWIQRPDVPSTTLLRRNPWGSFPMSAPAGAERRFSSGARVTVRS